MQDTNKVDPIPKSFASYEEAGEFWDTHDSMDYEQHLRSVEVKIGRPSRAALNLPTDVETALHKQARERGVSIEELAAELLREQLSLPQPVAA